MKKEKPLKVREQKFVANVVKGMPPTTAMREAGYTKETADQCAGKKFREPRIQTAIQRALEKAGITEGKLVEKLKEGLEATKVISANVVASNGDGMSDAHGTTKDFIDVPDYATQHKFLDTALKLGNHYPSEKVELSGAVEFTGIEIVFVKPKE